MEGLPVILYNEREVNLFWINPGLMNQACPEQIKRFTGHPLQKIMEENASKSN